MADSETLLTCPTCKEVKPMGQMEWHACSICKEWEPLKNGGTGICTQGNTHALLRNPGVTPPFFGCVFHSDALWMMDKKEARPVPKSRHRDTKVARKTAANSRSPKQRKLTKD